MKKTALLAALVGLALCAPARAGNPLVSVQVWSPTPGYSGASASFRFRALAAADCGCAQPAVTGYAVAPLYAAPSYLLIRSQPAFVFPVQPVQPAAPQVQPDLSALSLKLDAVLGALDRQERTRAGAAERLLREGEAPVIGAKKLPNGQPLEVKEEKR